MTCCLRAGTCPRVMPQLRMLLWGSTKTTLTTLETTKKPRLVWLRTRILEHSFCLLAVIVYSKCVLIYESYSFHTSYAFGDFLHLETLQTLFVFYSTAFLYPSTGAEESVNDQFCEVGFGRASRPWRLRLVGQLDYAVTLFVEQCIAVYGAHELCVACCFVQDLVSPRFKFCFVNVPWFLFCRYDPEGAKGAAGVLNAEMKADLRAQHFKLGYHPGAYESMEQERWVFECSCSQYEFIRKHGPWPHPALWNAIEKGVQYSPPCMEVYRVAFFCRCRVTSLAMAKRRAEILAEQPNGSSHLHPDLLVMKKNQAEVKQLKNSLLRTSIVIGDDDDYM